VRQYDEASVGSIIDEWMLKSKKRVHADAPNCHEPALHETAK
jgi:hypothetical protein